METNRTTTKEHTKRVNFVIRESHHKRLTEAARSKGVAISELLRKITEAYLESENAPIVGQ